MIKLKRNIFLRAALLLFIGVWASSTLFTGTAAKYVGFGEGHAKARYAAFSFEIGTKKYLGDDEWENDRSWDQLVTQDGISASQVFTLPLFGSEYLGVGDYNAAPTVKGIGGREVFAPGTGHGWIVGQSNNGNYDAADGHIDCMAEFKNSGEVSVRYRILYVHSPSAAAANIPLLMRTYPDQYYAQPFNWSAGQEQVMLDYDRTAVLHPGQSAKVGFTAVWPFGSGSFWDPVGFGYYADAAANDAADTARGKAAGIIELWFKIEVEQVD